MTTNAADLVSGGLLTVAEAMEFLKIRRTAIYEMMNDGRLASCKIGGARRIPAEAVRRLAAESVQEVLVAN